MIFMSNNAGSTLVVAISASATEVQVQTADAAEFPVLEYPGDVFPVRIRDNAGNYEYALATARDGNRITIMRGREGTTAKDFPAGAGFELVVTAEAWERLAEGRWVRPMDASRNLLLPTRVNASTFTIAGDVTAFFRPNRALHLIQTTDAYGYVATSSYAGGATTITVQSCTVDAGLALVELGLEVESAPKYGNAANADTLGGKTKAEVIAEALSGKAASATDADELGGKTRAEVVSEAQSGMASDAELAAALANLPTGSPKDFITGLALSASGIGSVSLSISNRQRSANINYVYCPNANQYLSAGSVVTITGMTGTGYNGTFTILGAGASYIWYAYTGPNDTYVADTTGTLTCPQRNGSTKNGLTISAGVCRDSTNTKDIVLSSTLCKDIQSLFAQGNNAGAADTYVGGSVSNIPFKTRQRSAGVGYITGNTQNVAPIGVGNSIVLSGFGGSGYNATVTVLNVVRNSGYTSAGGCGWYFSFSSSGSDEGVTADYNGRASITDQLLSAQMWWVILMMKADGTVDALISRSKTPTLPPGFVYSRIIGRFVTDHSRGVDAATISGPSSRKELHRYSQPNWEVPPWAGKIAVEVQGGGGAYIGSSGCYAMALLNLPAGFIVPLTIGEPGVPGCNGTTQADGGTTTFGACVSSPGGRTCIGCSTVRAARRMPTVSMGDPIYIWPEDEPWPIYGDDNVTASSYYQSGDTPFGPGSIGQGGSYSEGAGNAPAETSFGAGSGPFGGDRGYMTYICGMAAGGCVTIEHL
ncbi:MAG: hypothetical protein FD177_889 [Desulfovibrionaceae bacterium]|nr:MAG: hypothetical protein FD177_889 [Desulfovibrionaceae bacterium]